MIMGAAIASVAWICFVPWTKLKQLRTEQERQERTDPPGTDPA